MSNNLPPFPYIPNLYNSNDYFHNDSSLTLAIADARYLQLTGGILIGNLFCSNGLSMAGSILINSVQLNSTATELNYLHGVTLGTASGSQALVLDSSRNITNINNIGITTLSIGALVLNATDLGYINGVTPGTATASQALVLDSSRNIININNMTVSGILTTPNISISGTTDSISVSTGCLVLSGGMGIAKSLYVGGTINGTKFVSNNNGSNYSLVNGANSALIELAASPNILRLVNGYSMNLGSNGLMLSSANSLAARYQLDFNTNAADCQICLYQSSSNALYGIGANNSQMEFHSGANQGFCWYIGTTANGSLGTSYMNLSSTVLNIKTTNTEIPNGGWIGCNSSSNILNMNTNGVCLIGTSTVANTSNWLEVAAGSGSYSAYFAGKVGIGISNSSFPLSVFGNNTLTKSGSFGYLSSSGSGSASGFSNRPFSIYSDSGIIVSTGEIDSFSDIRMKTDINLLDSELANRFIKINPITFKYKKKGDVEYIGYSAQELLKNDFYHLVSCIELDDDDLIPMDVECIDGSIKHLPKNSKLVLNQLAMIPLIHKALQNALKRIEFLEKNCN